MVYAEKDRIAARLQILNTTEALVSYDMSAFDSLTAQAETAAIQNNETTDRITTCKSDLLAVQKYRTVVLSTQAPTAALSDLNSSVHQLK